MTADTAITAAIDWAIRQRDPAFADWEAFAAWLEADPAHQAAYHEALALDDALAALPRPALPHPALPVTKAAVRRPDRRRWMAAAVAAAVVAAIGFGGWQASPVRYATKPGERLEVRLDDGSTILLNGDTRLWVDRHSPRRVELRRGEALFHVAHQPGQPFRVAVGDHVITNLSTIFDVLNADGRIRVGVAEGAVAFDPEGRNQRVEAGQELSVQPGAAPQIRSAQGIGGWAEGQLVYDGAPLAAVAADIARTTGIAIRVTPQAAGLPFHGALHLDGPEAAPDAEQLAGQLAALSGTRAVAEREGWVLDR